MVVDSPMTGLLCMRLCVGLSQVQRNPREMQSRGRSFDPVYEAAGARHAQLVVPPTRTAKVSRRGPRSRARVRTISDVETLGRRDWQKASGYHRPAHVENAFFRYKSIIGDGLRVRSGGGRKVETSLACRVLNRMIELGRPESSAIAR